MKLLFPMDFDLSFFYNLCFYGFTNPIFLLMELFMFYKQVFYDLCHMQFLWNLYDFF